MATIAVQFVISIRTIPRTRRSRDRLHGSPSRASAPTVKRCDEDRQGIEPPAARPSARRRRTMRPGRLRLLALDVGKTPQRRLDRAIARRFAILELHPRRLFRGEAGRHPQLDENLRDHSGPAKRQERDVTRASCARLRTAHHQDGRCRAPSRVVATAGVSTGRSSSF